MCNNSSSQEILPKGTLLQKSLSSFPKLLNSILRQCFLSSTLHNVSLNASPRISSYFGRPPLSLCCLCDHLTLSLFAPSLCNVTMLVSMSIPYAHNCHAQNCHAPKICTVTPSVYTIYSSTCYILCCIYYRLCVPHHPSVYT